MMDSVRDFSPEKGRRNPLTSIWRSMNQVYKRSYDIRTQLYKKELLTGDSYLHRYGLQDTGFNAQQLAVVTGLCEWRDVVALTEDESTGIVLPNKTLLDIGDGSI